MSNPDDGNKTVFRPSPLAGRTAGGTLLPTQPGNPWPGQNPSPTTAAAAPASNAPAAAGQDLVAIAAPVLSMATTLRGGNNGTPLSQLHGRAVQAITRFDAAVQPLVGEDVRRQAVYAVSATIDDVAVHAPGVGDDAAEWARRSMVAQFSGATAGDDRFWSLIDEATRPPVNAELIALLQACLAAGYQGHFRGAPDAQRQVQQASARLHASVAPPPPPAAKAVAAPPAAAARATAAAPATPRATQPTAAKRSGRTLAITAALVVVLALALVAAKLLLPSHALSLGSGRLSQVDQARQPTDAGAPPLRRVG